MPRLEGMPESPNQSGGLRREEIAKSADKLISTIVSVFPFFLKDKANVGIREVADKLLDVDSDSVIHRCNTHHARSIRARLGQGNSVVEEEASLGVGLFLERGRLVNELPIVISKDRNSAICNEFEEGLEESVLLEFRTRFWFWIEIESHMFSS